MTDITPTNWSDACVTGINDVGLIVGYGSSPGGTHAFVYNSGTINDPATLGGGFSSVFVISITGHVTG
jgi:probable HAF family extracellular repeat protein